MVASPTSGKPALRAGAAQIEISPGPGLALAGYPHFLRHNTGIHDPLMAGCIVLDDGATRLALVCLDLLMISRRYVQSIRRKLEERTGIPAAHIMLSCSHTHSGPWASDWVEPALPSGLIGPDAAYMAALEDKLVHLAAAAAGDMFAARLGVERGICGQECGIGGNRRDPAGPADPEVWTLGIQDAGGKWRACLVKYALHPTVLHEDSALVSADYPAYLRQFLSCAQPGLKMLFAQGTAGDQSTRYFRRGQSFAEAERIGTAIGRVALQALERMTFSAQARLGACSAMTDLLLRELPDQTALETRVAQAKRKYEALKAAGGSYLEIQNANLTLLGEEDTLSFARMKEKGVFAAFLADALPAEVQVLALGDARLVALPGEVFLEFGRRIQAGSPCPKTFVVTLANGILPGYVCTAEAYGAGGYETGASLLTAQAGEALVATALRLLNRPGP